MECTRWHKNQQAYLKVVWKENKTDDIICLHFGVYGNICGHMIPSSEYAVIECTMFLKLVCVFISQQNYAVIDKSMCNVLEFAIY